MEHFISVVIPKQNKINEDSIAAVLTESCRTMLLTENKDLVLVEAGVTEDDDSIVQIELPRELTEDEADRAVNEIATKIFGLGFDDFDVYVSGGDEE